MKKRLYFLLLLKLGLCANLKAQEVSTETSIRRQLVENKIPGAKYAPPKQTNAVKSKGFEGSSLGKQIKEGKEDGMKYNLSTSTAPKNPVGISNEKTVESGSNLNTTEENKNTKENTPKVSNQEKKKE